MSKTPEEIAQTEWPFALCTVHNGVSLDGDKIRESFAAALRSYRNEGLEPIEATVNEQAEDDGLWFVAKYASEAYLQKELRRLHEVVESAVARSLKSKEPAP